MKLRNRKTGKIVKLEVHQIAGKCYESLAEVNEDWEDYKEPEDNGYWYIDDLGGIQFSSKVLDEIDGYPNNWMIRKSIGNYFKFRYDAEKAVEKWKAFTRLQGKGFRFSNFVYTELCDYARVNISATMINDSINDDLELLFGGEQ